MVIYLERVDIIKYSSTVAQHVASALKENHRSVLSISNETSIPRTTLTRRLASPETSPFTVVELGKIATAIGIPITSLLENNKNKKSPQVPAAGNRD